MTITKEHIAAVERAIGNAEDESRAEREVAAFSSCASWQAKHNGRAAAVDADAARLAEVAAYLRSQARRSVWDLDVAALPAAPTQQGDE